MPHTHDNSASILVALRKIIRAVDRHSKNLAQRHGVTGPQLVLLRELESAQEELTVGVLARRVSLSQATVTSVLDRLEKCGFARRTRGTRDRRQVLLALTDRGREVLRKAPPLLQERFVQELAALKGWEQTLILSSLQRVAAMMEADQLDATPMLVSGPVAATEQETKEFLSPQPSNDNATSTH